MQAGTFSFLSMGSFCVRGSGSCLAGDARRKADRERRTGHRHWLTPHSPPRACRAIAARSRAIAPSEAATGRRERMSGRRGDTSRAARSTAGLRGHQGLRHFFSGQSWAMPGNRGQQRAGMVLEQGEMMPERHFLRRRSQATDQAHFTNHDLHATQPGPEKGRVS